MDEQRTLECSYSPADFFEASDGFTGPHYRVEIINGRVVATFTGESTGDWDTAYREVYAAVQSYFRGAQLERKRRYELTGYITTRRANGNVEVGVSMSATLVAAASLDMVLLDSNGNVKVDTKAERIGAQKKFAELALKYQKDPVVAALLSSYNNSINDPQNALTHLYEIRDAVKKDFGGEDAACDALHVSKSRWKQLGILANVEPLEQGRHRGQNVGQLRDATEAELEEACGIARKIVEAYFDYLEGKTVAAKAQDAPTQADPSITESEPDDPATSLG